MSQAELMFISTRNMSNISSLNVKTSEVPDEVENTVSGEEKEEDLRYGFCGWKPRSLQALNNIKVAVFFISLANCLQNAANGLLGVSISTLEKRFSFSSVTSSIIASSYEFGQVPAIILIMIFGHRWAFLYKYNLYA